MLDKSTNKRRQCDDGPKHIGEFVYQSKAIETLYGDVMFKSRLEARWAAFFDLMGWQWTYEPIDLDGWIPDFQLGVIGGLVEVKPFLRPGDWQAMIADIARALQNHDMKPRVLLLGVSPMAIVGDYVSIGWMLEYHGEWMLDTAVVGRYGPGGPMGCHANSNDWTCFVSGVHHGGTTAYFGGDEVGANWRKASNVTQWRHRK